MIKYLTNKSCALLVSSLLLSACSYSDSGYGADSYYYGESTAATGYYAGQQAYGSPGLSNCGNTAYAPRSRYGTSTESSANQGCSGYWVIPTYQVIETPAPTTTSVSTPVTTTTIATTECEDGQYKMADGTCAVMIEDTPQYTPPVTSYPEAPYIPADVYLPIRK